VLRSRQAHPPPRAKYLFASAHPFWTAIVENASHAAIFDPRSPRFACVMWHDPQNVGVFKWHRLQPVESAYSKKAPENFRRFGARPV